MISLNFQFESRFLQPAEFVFSRAISDVQYSGGFRSIKAYNDLTLNGNVSVLPNTTAEFTAREFVKAKSEFHAFRNAETHLYCSSTLAECVDPYPLVDYYNDPTNGRGRLAFSGTSKEIILKLNSERKDITSIFPNPNDGFFKIKSNFQESVTIEITDAMGVLIDTYQVKGEKSIDKSQLSGGLYFVVTKNSNQIVQTNRLIIQK